MEETKELIAEINQYCIDNKFDDEQIADTLDVDIKYYQLIKTGKHYIHSFIQDKIKRKLCIG